MSTYSRFTHFLRSRFFSALAIFIIGFSSGPAPAATLYWDTDSSLLGNDVDGAGLGGPGTWDTSALTWWDLSSLAAWNNLAEDEAVFSYAYPALGIPTNQAVAIDAGGVAAGQVSFLRSGYTLSGGALTLSGSNPTLHATLGDSATIASNLLGTSGLRKTGGGSIRLTGDNSGLTGVLSVANGTLIINSALALPGTGAVSILTNNETPSNTNQLGFTGGSLMLDGTAGGFTVSRDINLEGRGPIGDRGAAILNVGNNTLSGVVTTAVSPLSPATFRNSRITSVNGMLNLSGTLASQGTTGTTFVTFGGINSTGVANYNLSGILSGTGSIEKSGAGTLFLNPASTSGFTGTVRISGSATGQQSSVRVTQASAGGTSVFGANVGTGSSSVIDLNGGLLEFRSEGDLDFGSLASGKNVYSRSGGSIFTGPAAGGDAILGTTTLGTLQQVVSTTGSTATTTFNSRNGFGVTFSTMAIDASTSTSTLTNTLTNNLGGTLRFTGNITMGEGSTASRPRIISFAGNGNTYVQGSIISGTDPEKTLNKSGSGNLTIQGTGTTVAGGVNISGGAITITDFRSLNNNTSAITLGNTTTTAGNLIIGTATTPTAGGLTTSKPIVLNGTTAGNAIYANQPGTNPAILNGAITKPIVGLGVLNLGGTNNRDNVINSSIPDGGVTGATTAGAAFTAGATSITLANVTGISIGNTITGTGIAAGTTVTAVNPVTRVVTLSLPASAAGTSGQAITSPNIIGVTSVSKVGSGTWVLAGANGYTGTTTISNGTLKIRANAPTSTVLGASNALTFTATNGYAGGRLEFVGQAGENNLQSLGTLSYAGAGAHTISLTPGAGGTASLEFGNIATGGAGTVNIVGADFVNNRVTLSQINAATGSDGIVTRSLYWEGADFAYRQGGVLRAPNYGVDTLTATTAAGPLTASSNNRITGSLSTNAISVATLKIDGSHTLTVNTGNLTLSAGGLLVSGGDAEITGAGTIALGTNAFVVRVNLEGDDLLISTTGLTGTGGLTKSGAGTLTIATSNARTGTTEIAEGTVRLSGSGTLSGANVTTNIRQAGTLDLNGVSTGTSIGGFNNMGLVTNDSDTDATLTIGNAITTNGTAGTSYGIISDGTGTGKTNLTISTANNTASQTTTFVLNGLSSYTGVTTLTKTTLGNLLVSANTLADIGEDSSIGRGIATNDTTNAESLVFSGLGAELRYIGNILNGNLTLGSTSASTNRLFTVSGSAATLSNTASNNNAIVWSNPGPILHGSNANRTLTLGGTVAADNTFNPQWTNSTGFISSLTKTGTGQWNLGNTNNTYTGLTTVANGILALNDNGALPSGSPVVLGSTTTSGTLQMSGTFARNLSATPTAGTGTVTWGGTTGSGGFAAHSTPLTVTLNGGAGLTWGAGGFVGTGGTQALILSSVSALSDVTFTNAIDLAGAARTVTVNDNTTTATDYATLGGVISGAAGSALTKTGNGVLRLGSANTYEGTTQVSAGTLSVSRLGHSGTPGASSVGDSTAGNTNAGAILLGNGTTTGGLLQYTGAGEISDRKIRLNTTTGTNQIHADGTGALILTNVVNDLGVGNKTLSLRGNNTAGNMITSQLSDNGGTLGVTVDGGATWILSNPANNYTGTTTAGAGALGIGHNTAIGAALTISNGNVFAYGGDRTLTNTVNMGNNATSGFIGDYNITFNGTNNLAASANNLNLYNSIVAGKSVTFQNLLANSITANRTWTLDGPGETVVNGDFTTSTTFGVNISKTGNGTLVLGTNGATSNWNQAGGNIDIDRGTLRFTASEAIPTLAPTNGGLILSPEVATTDTATVDLNGTTQTVNALTATSNGTLVLDNTSNNPATFRFGANNSTVNFGSGLGNYSIQNSGVGALSIVKLGNTGTTFNSGMTLNHAGITASEGGGTFTIASPVTATSGLRAIEGSTLALTGGITNPGLVTSIEVGGGSTLSLLDGAGSLLYGLTNLNLGAGSGTATLNLNIGDSATDTLTLQTGGTLNLANTVTFNLTDSGLSPLTTYTLLNLVDGGIGGFGLTNMVQGTTPGGFDGFTWNVTNNLVQITTGNLVTGDLFWRGLAGGGTDNTWNANANNWSLDKANTSPSTTTPGQGTDVIFAINSASGDVVTTLEQNFKINSLTFEAGTTTPASVTIAPGASATNRLEVAPQLPADGIAMNTGGPSAVTISAPLRLGADQTWHVADAVSLANATFLDSSPNITVADTTGLRVGMSVVGAGIPAGATVASITDGTTFVLSVNPSSNQTGAALNAAATLTLSNSLLGEAGVTKTGAGKVILSAAADPTFNSGQTASFTIDGGALEMTNIGALGTAANSNLANIIINTGGAFYFNGAASTIPNPLTMGGGTLSSGSANQIYSGAVNFSEDSFINLRDSNSPVLTTTQRAVTLGGVLSGTGNLTLDSINTATTGNQITGDLVITNPGNSGWSGDLIVRSGTVTARTGNGDALGSGAITIELGKVEWEGAGGATYNINKPLTVARAGGNAIAEWNIDRTSGTGTFTVDNSGAVTLGGTGGTGELRVFFNDIATNNVGTSAIFSGAVTLANNASILSRDNGTLALATFSGGISESGGSRTLTINGPAGGGPDWGGTDGIVHLSGAGSYTGGTTLAGGGLRFGNKDAIGTGALTISGTSTLSASTPLTGANAVTNAISQNASFTFFGANSLELGGGINLGAGVRTITANGDTGASLILGGAISNLATADGSALTLAGNATGTGTIRGGFLMTADSADLSVTGGAWTHETGTSRVGDDATVTGANAVLNLDSGLLQVRDDFTVTTNGKLNLNGAGVLSFSTPTLSADASLRAVTGGTITINADNAVSVTDFDGLRIGTDGSGTGNLVMNANQQVVEFIIGNRNADRTGNVTGTGTITVTGNLDLYQGSIAANLASTGSTAFEKISRNTVTLSGDNSGLASTGASTIFEGSLILDYTSSNTTKLRAASALEMRGSNLILNGNNSAATSQSVGSFTLANGFGSSNITLNAGTGQEIVLNLGAITRAVNARAGTVRFFLPSGVQSATNGITTTTGVTNGLLGLAGYATVDDGTGTWFATKSGTNIVALASTPKNDVATWLTGDHVTDETTGFTGTFASVLINSLRFDAATGGIVNLGGGGVLGIASGGILVTDNVAGSPGIFGGTIFSGAQASNVPELIVTHDGTTNFEIGADIRANTALTKSGTGTVLLSGNNTSISTVTVHNGVLELAGGNALGDNSLVTLANQRNSTLRLLANETIGRLDGGQRQTEGDWGLVEIGSHTLTLNFTGGNTSFSGRFLGTGNLVLSPSSTSNFNLAGISTGFTGNVEIKGGLFQLSGSGQIDASSFSVSKGGALLIDNNGNTRSGTRILNTATIVLDSADGPFSGETRPRGLAIRTSVNAETNETVGDVTFNSGANYFAGEASGTTGRAAIFTSNFLRLNGSTLNARGRALGLTTGDRNQFRITDATNQTNFIATMIGGGGAADSATLSILPWAIGENLTTTLADGNMGNTFLTYVSGAGFRPLNLVTEYSTYATAGDTNNVRESRSTDLTGQSGRMLNSLVINNDNAAALAFSGSGIGQSLTNTSGGFLFTLTNGVASAAYQTTLGGFDDGILTPSGEYIFHVINPSSATTTSTLTATVSSPLNSTADLIKSGRGTLVLTGVNAAGGGTNRTTINEGVLEISDLDNIGGTTGNLVFAGGTLRLSSTFDELTDDLSSRTILFLSGGGTLDTNGNDPVFAGTLGSGSGGFTKIGLGNLTLNAAATYTGATTLSAGTVTIGANDALGVGGNLTIGAGTTLALGTNSLSHGLVTTTGASPIITGTGTINATTGFFFNHSGNTTIDAVLAGSGGLLKAQTNVVTLTGANTYTGTTEIQNGTLSLNSIGNVGGGASAIGAPTTVENGIIRMGLSTASTTLQYTGAGHTSDRLIGMQGTTGGVTIDADGTGALVLGGVRTENAGNKTLTLRGSSDALIGNTLGAIREIGAVLTVNKSDGNTWILSEKNTYSGATQVDNGILRLGVDDALPVATALRIGTGATAGTLDLNGFDQTIGSLVSQTNSASVTNTLIIDTGNTLTVNGAVTIGVSAAAGATTLFTATGGGDFVNNNTGGTFQIGGGTGGTNTNAVTADFSALANFTVDLGPTGTFRVGDANSNTSGSPASSSTLILASTSASITAGTINLGQGTGQGSADQALKLGAGTNELNADVINIGGNTTRSGGSLEFAGSTGSVVIRGSDGVGAADVNMVNGAVGTGIANQTDFRLAGHTADVLIDTMVMAAKSSTSGATTANFTFDEGTLDIATLSMTSSTGSYSGAATSNVTLGGGTTTIDALTMAANTSSGAGTANANLDVTGGTVTIGAGSGIAINMANAGTGRTVNSTIDITGGTLNMTGDIVRTGGAGTENATITLDGGTLDLNGNDIGSSTATIAFNAQAGTLRNLGELNGGGNLVKTTAGTLVLAGDNHYTGRTVVNAGILSVSTEQNIGDNPAAFNAAQLEIDGGTLLNTASFTIDDANRGITIGAAGGTIETTAATALTVAATNPIVLTGALTKTGDGALYVNSATSGTGAINVTDGTFGGTGTISGNTTIANGAVLTGGTDGTVGTINFNGTLTNDTGATWLIDLVSDVNGSADLVNLGIGSLNLNSAALNLVTSGIYTVGNSYTIATYASLAGTFNGLSEGAIISGYQINYGSNAITLTAVPEPGTLGLLGLALGGFFFRRLRKRRNGAAGKE
jgi:autotransporter-associated beta strand protein